MHIASLVMGIVSLVFSWVPVWGFIIAIAALVIAIIAMVTKKGEEKGKGMKIAGIILSIIAVVISLIIFVGSYLLVTAVGDVVNLGKDMVDDMQQDMVTDATESMSQSLQSQILRAYNNKILSGVQARSAIMQYMTSKELTTVLMNGTQMVATSGAKKLASESLSLKEGYYEITKEKYLSNDGTLHKTSMSDFTVSQNQSYVDIAAKYQSYLLKIAGSSEVVGIVFVKQ